MVFWTACACARTAVSVSGPRTVKTSLLDGGLGLARLGSYQTARERWLEEMTVELIETAHKARPGHSGNAQPGPGYTRLVHGPKTYWGRHDTFVAGDLYGGRDEQLVISKVDASPRPAATGRVHDLSPRQHTEPHRPQERAHHACRSIGHNGTRSAFLFIDAIDPRGTVNAGVYERIGRVFKETARYEPFLGRVAGRRRCLSTTRTTRGYFPATMACHRPRCHTPSAELPHLNAVTGAATQLQRVHIPFGVITRSGLGHLSEYRVVLLPDVLRMDEEELRAFRSYVEGGGHLYSSGRTSLLGTDGSVEAISGWPTSSAPTSRRVRWERHLPSCP